jgi:hypothetical protein
MGTEASAPAMREVQKKFLPHPLAPLLKAFGMAGKAGSSQAIHSNFSESFDFD